MSEEPAKNRLHPGDRIAKYEVVEFIASGGMGSVYKARDTDLDRIIALKILTPAMAKQPKMLDRFRREARAAARLQHENIVAIYEFGEQAGVWFLALEYVPGVDLQDYIDKRKKLAPEEARGILVQATRALVHAHAQKIVHRDVKPSNILLTRKDGRLVVKLTDLGLAIQANDEEFRLTREGTTVGTVDYMAPEQARDSGRADIRSDIYSLGCTFYHLLAGTAPFARGTMAERLLQHMQDEAPDVRELNHEVPSGYVAILARMLAKKPEDRYQTPEELLRDLEDPDRVRQPAAADSALPSMTDVAAPVPVARKAPARPRRSGPVSAAPVSEPERPAPKEPRTQETPTRGPRPKSRPGKSGVVPAAKDQSERPVKDLRSSTSPWVFLVAGGVGVVLVAVVGLLLTTGGTPPPKKDVPEPVMPPTLPTPIAGGPIEPEPKKDPGTPTVGGDTSQAGPPVPGLPKLFPSAAPPDEAALRQEFYGRFAAFPQPPAIAPVSIVKRGAAPGSGTNTFRTLAEAMSLAPPGVSVIEIHDRGPLFLDKLPSLEGRDLFLRAGPGFRPLLAWDPPRAAPKDKAGAVLLAHRRGRLVVEGLDIVVKWTDPQAAAPARLFQIAGGALFLRDCTFSLTGKHPRGIILADIQPPDGKARPDLPPQLRLSRCYVRGTDLTAAALAATCDALIDNSLLVGHDQPMLRVACGASDEVKLRVVRSTLVTGENLLHVRSAAEKAGGPRLAALVWDSILARDDRATAAGDLVALADGASADSMSWRAENSVYAGWKKLLAGSAPPIDGDDVKAWQARWQGHSHDRPLPDTWPSDPPAQLGDIPAAVFSPYDGPVAFAAEGGAIGAIVGRLPPAPNEWLMRTFDRPPPPLPAAVAAAAPAIPAIDAAVDGRYHGEIIHLQAGADLGRILAAKLHGQPLAPRVVIHVAGRGNSPTSALRVKGVAELVLYFVPPDKEANADPLTLTVAPAGVLDRRALIEMDGGTLELINARIRFDNSKIAIVPPHVLRAAGGNLHLTRCRLTGPLAKSPEAFQSLIALAGAGAAPVECRLSECVLLSGKHVVQTTGVAARLAVRHSVILALGDALETDLAGVPAAEHIVCQLDSNTWALRQALIAPQIANAPLEPADRIRVEAVANYFADPFDQAPARSALLRSPESLLPAGQLLWQGRANAFDRRLGGFYYSTAGPVTGEKQTLADWLQLWGPSGELDALHVDPAPMAKGISADAPQLERLALPRTLRPTPGNPMPGADLVRLGLLKKKG